MKIELSLDDKEKAKEQIKLIQQSFDEIVKVNQMQKAQLQKNADDLDQSAKSIKSYQDSAISLIEAIRNIHSLLGAKSDLINSDKQLVELRNSLGVILLNSASIKLGVINNEKS